MLWTGKHVVRGDASKAFHPFLLSGDLKGSSEELKNKLMVDFDPLRCFVGDLEASLMKLTFFYYIDSISLPFWYSYAIYAERVSKEVEVVVWFFGRWCCWPDMGERLLKGIYDFKFYTENIFLVYLFTNLSLVEPLNPFNVSRNEIERKPLKKKKKIQLMCWKL